MVKLFRAIALMLGRVKTPPLETKDMPAWDFEFTTLDGGDLPLRQYSDKVLLVVNTASQCGFTPQYQGLESLYRHYRDRGLVVIGVPSNDFGGQEPGTAAEIQNFCTSKFAVDFPMAGKETVVGAEAHPFYRWVVGKKGDAAAPRWNFHKILIGRDGEVVETFSSRVKPDSAELTGAVEAALG